jgi:riboflavin biosynthesis pyrimidine reductase
VIISRVHPAPAEPLELDDDGTRARLLDWYSPDRAEWVRVNLVMSVNGSAAGSDGTSETLTSASDRRILGVIRELSDVVLIGAASVRAEGYQVPKRARLAILTATGDLAGHRLDPAQAERVIILCPEGAAAAAVAAVPGAHVIVVPAFDEVVSPADAIDALRAAGCAGIVCEGGPSLAARLIEAGLVDDVCLTTSPLLRDASVPLLGHGPLSEHPLALRHVLVDDDGYVFTRWGTRTV